MPGDTVDFSEPRFHSIARPPYNSRPTIEVAHLKEPCVFSVEFAAGKNDAERIVMRVNGIGVREVPELIRKGELLFTRVAIPSGQHEVKITIKWNPIER